MVMKQIGRNCQNFRRAQGYTQLDVARDLDYSVENISGFERGRNDNIRIFMWYVSKGMTIDDLMKGVELNYGV